MRIVACISTLPLRLRSMVCIYHVVSVHPFMGIWAVSTFWLLQIVMLWMFLQVFEHLYSILLGIYLRVGFLGSMFNILKNHHTVFHSGWHFTFPSAICRVLLSPHSCEHLFSFLKIVAVLVGVKWYLIVIMICIHLLNSSFHVPTGCLFWRNVWVLCPFLIGLFVILSPSVEFFTYGCIYSRY